MLPESILTGLGSTWTWRLPSQRHLDCVLHEFAFSAGEGKMQKHWRTRKRMYTRELARTRERARRRTHTPPPAPAHAQVMLTTGRAGAVLTEDYFAAENRLVHRLLDSQAGNMHII